MKRSTEAIKSARLFQEVFESAPVSVSILDPKDDSYIAVNKAFERMTGWKRDDLIGRTPSDSRHWIDPLQSRDIATRIDIVKKLMAKETVQNVSIEFQTKEGAIRTGLASAALIDGYKVLYIAPNITQLRQPEELDSWFGSIVESSDDAIIAKNLDGVISAWNKGAERMFGYTREEALGQPITIIIPPELRDEEPEIVSILRAGGRIDHYETQRLSKSGQLIDVSITISPVRDIEGHIIGASKIVRDISERKRAEEDFRKINQKVIEAQENERSRLARELHDDLSQRFELVSLTLDSLAGRVPVSADKFAAEIRGASKRVGELGEELRAISHRLRSPELGTAKLEKVAAWFCKEFSHSWNVETDFKADEMPGELPREISLSLYRVLQEALQNAAKHSMSRQFKVSLRNLEGEIEMAVKDSGGGFQQEAAHAGRGLGLNSMKERLRLVGGYLSIESNPQRGTTIVARVPFKSQGHAALAARSNN